MLKQGLPVRRVFLWRKGAMRCCRPLQPGEMGMLSPLPGPQEPFSFLSICLSLLFIPVHFPRPTSGPFISREFLLAVSGSDYLQGSMFHVGGQIPSMHFLSNTPLVPVSVPKCTALFALTTRKLTDRQFVALSAEPSGYSCSINLSLLLPSWPFSPLS